jgi:hypothetical protein
LLWILQVSGLTRDKGHGLTQNQVGVEMPTYERGTIINMRKEETLIIVMWECNTAYV